MDSPGRKCMRPIPIAQYLNQFGRAEPTPADRVHRDSVLLRPRVLSVPADIDARIEEALERGRSEGLAAGRAESAAALHLEQADWEAQENQRRLAWQANEMAQFAEKIEGAMATIEDRL